MIVTVIPSDINRTSEEIDPLAARCDTRIMAAAAISGGLYTFIILSLEIAL